MKKSVLSAGLLFGSVVMLWGTAAQSQDFRIRECMELAAGQNQHFMETGAQCDQDLGIVRLVLDNFGSTGSATNGDLACFNPFDDMPDDGSRSTIFESMAHVCRTSGNDTQGKWLEGSDQSGANPVVRPVGDEIFTDFTTVGVRVEGRFRLNCSVLEKCYTLTNATGAEMQTVALTHYMDGDLYFRQGNLSDDFGATSDGAPKTLWQFEEGDIGVDGQPATFVGMYALGGGNEFLQSWEVGSFPDQKNRIDGGAGDFFGNGGGLNTCHQLANNINRQEMNIDVNPVDLTTDRGFDVTLALRYDLGPLAPGESSEELCVAIQWGRGLPCSDEDQDEICLQNDNCPAVPNPDQLDEDNDGVGDLCDNCPKISNPPDTNVCRDLDDNICADGEPNCTCRIEQADSDQDGQGDQCDRVLCTPGPIPQGSPPGFIPDEICDGRDNDCDGLTDIRPDGTPAVAPGRCATGLADACAVGTWQCVAGNTRCVPDTSPAEEVCDLADNDCDGKIDERVRNACGTCGGPAREECDGFDDDCDGTLDEDAACGDGLGCYEAECLPACDADGNCAAGAEAFCADGVCVPWCRMNGCENEGDVCTPMGCGNPCAGVECAEGQVCFNGECGSNDCIRLGCPDGQRCRPDGCEPDPCADKECGSDSFCRDGECVFSCAEVSCPAAQACIDGLCQPTGCADSLGCPEAGEVCVDDQCVPDPCANVMCRAAEVCLRGECIADPCVGVACPNHQKCVVTDGTAQCVGDWPINEPDPSVMMSGGPDRGNGDEGGDLSPNAMVDGAASENGAATPDGQGSVGGANAAGSGSAAGGANANGNPGLMVSGNGESGGSSGGCQVGTSGSPVGGLLLLLSVSLLMLRRRWSV